MMLRLWSDVRRALEAALYLIGGSKVLTAEEPDGNTERASAHWDRIFRPYLPGIREDT